MCPVSYTHLLEAIAAQGYSYKDGQLEKQQPEATPDSLVGISLRRDCFKGLARNVAINPLRCV